MESSLASRPLVAVTMGDPSGVGPEVVVGAWRDAALHGWRRPVVIGHPGILRRAAKLLNWNGSVREIAGPQDVGGDPNVLDCVPIGEPGDQDIPACRVSARAGELAYQAVMKATDWALAGQVDAVATAPLNKAALWEAGHHYPGHTELLAERCGAPDFAMMLYLAPGGAVQSPAGLGVVHVTLHMALADVFRNLTIESVERTIRLADRSLVPFNAGRPRLGICALNPHAGESGLFGREELEIIRPAVERARRDGIDATDPLPADTLLLQARDGRFDGVVAMYHDQGHIALKLIDMHRAVNVTLGLPIIRTSAAHGTAFDLAWQGRAESTGMIEAIRVASDLARRRMLHRAAHATGA